MADKKAKPIEKKAVEPTSPVGIKKVVPNKKDIQKLLSDVRKQRNELELALETVRNALVARGNLTEKSKVGKSCFTAIDKFIETTKTLGY